MKSQRFGQNHHRSWPESECELDASYLVTWGFFSDRHFMSSMGNCRDHALLHVESFGGVSREAHIGYFPFK